MTNAASIDPRPGGRRPAENRLVSLVHTVFNAGIGVSWEENAKEPRYFAPLSRWTELLRKAGFEDLGIRLLQANDPSDNTLMAFRKV